MNQAIATRGALFWLMQRLTGLFLAVFLFTHVKVLHWDFNFTKASTGFLDFTFVINRLHGNLGWGIFYFLFIISALFHGLNGLWAIVLDFRPSRGIQVAWLSILWAAGILTSLWGLYTLRAFYFAGGGPA
jgi:succinate dehydrogenase hydrophobic anchor subunit